MNEQRPLWEVLSVVLEAAATVVVAVFAAIQLVKEWRRDRGVRRGADAKISAIAYPLRRQLRQWLGSGSAEDGLETWLRAAQNAHSLAPELDAAEARITEIVRLAAEASRSVANSVRKAYVRFYLATAALNEYASTPRPDGNEFFDWLRLRTDAVRELGEAVAELEGGAIDKSLLADERHILQKRIDEEPFGQLTNALVAQGQQNVNPKHESSGSKRGAP
jgi:hypothetical protein